MPHDGNGVKVAQLTFYSVLDFGFEVFKEKIAHNGEDSYLYMFAPENGVAAVFDGCGGSGAKRYEKFRNKTGAYMASRVTAGAARDWFLEKNTPKTSSTLKEKIKEYLTVCKTVGGGTASFKGSMSKDFPTTAAVVVATLSNNRLVANCLWAGDSRCYLLDEDGLKQISEDDLGGIDAMENLTTDGVLTNVITASKDFVVHEKTIELKKPGILFAATDGCFGYFATPMEFEQLLLSTLMASSSASSWEEQISSILKEIAGDDYTMSGMAFGFRSFEKLKEAMENRYHVLRVNYTDNLSEKTYEEKLALWQKYKEGYYYGN